jgi:hypothetical protein
MYSLRENIDWLSLMDGYGRNLLFALGIDKSILLNEINVQGFNNPLVYRLQQDPIAFVRACKEAGNGTENMDGVSRAVVLTQMVYYDRNNGPEGDGKEKALRRHWYAYFKQFSQMFAFALGKTRKNDQGLDEMVDVQWSGRLSKVYAGFVDSGAVTYKNLWIEDASRMMNVFGTYDTLFPGFQLIIAVEKDSLFSDFVSASKALGALGIISGKGKNSKAAAELMLRKLGWKKDWNPLDNYETLVIHLSDHDFDGEGVIGPTFGEQMRRYLNNIEEARIGVKPEQVESATGNAWDASYQVKVSNKGYRDWANEKALFWATCDQCGHEQYVIGCDENGASQEECANCGSFELNVIDSSYDEPHGFEVESLRSSDYYRAMVDAVLDLHDFQDIVEQLRSNCKPNLWSIIEQIKDEKLKEIPRYQKLSQAIDLLTAAQQELEHNFDAVLQDYVNDAINEHNDSLWALQDDPTVDDLKDYVVEQARSGYGAVWRPFSSAIRERYILDRLEENEEVSDALSELDVEDYATVVSDVQDALED